MITKNVEVNGKTFVVRELLASEWDTMQESVSGLDEKERNKELTKKNLLVCANLTEEQYKELTVKEKIALITTMNQLNDISDFLQMSLTPEQKT